MQITETAGRQEFVAELEGADDETHTVTLEYRRPEPDDRYRYAEKTAGEASDAKAMAAAIELCVACTEQIAGLTGPDGEPVDWQDGDALVEQFDADSPDHARRFILQHLGRSYADADRLVMDYHLEILGGDRLDEEEQNLSGPSSDAA